MFECMNWQSRAREDGDARIRQSTGCQPPWSRATPSTLRRYDALRCGR